MVRGKQISMEDIIDLCSSLALTEAEESEVVLNSIMRTQGEEKPKLSLFERFLANKQINSEAFRSTITNIWRTNQEVQIVDLNNNTYAFHFSSLIDRKRLLVGGPWHFDNYVMVLEEPSRYGELQKMKFNRVEFWIQIHNVPLFCMTQETCLFLAEQIGRVIDIDEGEENRREERFIRVRVVVDVQKPLKRLLKVDLTGSGEIRMLLLRYERLPDFCFGCGLLRHGERECPTNPVTHKLGSRPYGPWMRATSPPRRQSFRAKKDGNLGRELEIGSLGTNRAGEERTVNRTEKGKKPAKVGSPKVQELEGNRGQENTIPKWQRTGYQEVVPPEMDTKPGYQARSGL